MTVTGGKELREFDRREPAAGPVLDLGQKRPGIQWAADGFINALRREGVTHFQFYILNRADLVYAICRVLGLGSTVEAA